MAKEELYDDLYDEKEEKIDYRELIFKYINHWPWFVASVVACVLLAFVWLRYQAPVYEVSSSILIKEDDKKSSNNLQNMMQDFGVFSMTNNFDNEIEILRSRTLIKKVVSTLGLYISTAEKRTFGYNIPLYNTSPVSVYMTAEEADRLKGGIEMDLDYTPGGSLKVKGTYKMDEEEYDFSEAFDRLPAVLPLPVGVVTFAVGDTTAVENKGIKLKAYISTPTATAKAYSGNLTIEPVSKQSTIATISLKNTVQQRAVDFIHTLVAHYNQDTNTEKNEVAQKSADFIEERINIINQELGTTESELAEFKQRSGLTDLESDAQLALQESSRYEQQYTETTNQINLVTFLRDYINNPANNEEVIPANVGLKDMSLSSVIDQYNTLILERKRLLRTSSENNPAVINLNTGIEAMRHNVQTTVSSVLSGLQLTLANIRKQGSKYESRISNAPKQEKEFMTIARQQEIKATLYITLLQKREENAITLASTANNGRIIEEPMAGEYPVSPKNKIILLAALIIGLGIPMGIIYLLDLLRYKIEGRSDVEKLTAVPVVGEVPFVKQQRAADDPYPEVMVREGENDIMAEVFRNVRTNLLFILGDADKKVVLVTSTTSGEGKSFFTSNLASSLALMGKRVILMGLDIRKPGLNKVFKRTTKAKGITQYLASPGTVDYHTLIQPSEVTPNLDLMLGGPVPPNPTELLARKGLEDLIESLKKEYDYIILDTAPIGMVTDTQLIARVADASIYVCRADYTNKHDYQFINELQGNKRLPNLCTVVNAVDISSRTYGYGRKYGYGYGYGYGFEKEK